MAQKTANKLYLGSIEQCEKGGKEPLRCVRFHFNMPSTCLLKSLLAGTPDLT